MEIPNEKNRDNSEIIHLLEKLSIEQEKLKVLEGENKKLREEIDGLKLLHSDKNGTNNFIEASGVLWKRKPSGDYELIPYCPTCKSTLADYSGSLLCLKCNWQAPIKSFEAPKVHHDLLGERS
jgi:hypothetical protein